jgi:hypothetical protein
MINTKSLFVKVATPLAILICGIFIGRYLLSTKPKTPKNTKYVYYGERESEAPLEPLGYSISNYKNINKFGAVPDAATAYEICNAILIATYGKDKIDYSEPFSVELRNKYIWTVGAVAQYQPFWFYNIDIDKRDGCIIDFRLAK